MGARQTVPQAPLSISAKLIIGFGATHPPTGAGLVGTAIRRARASAAPARNAAHLLVRGQRLSKSGRAASDVQQGVRPPPRAAYRRRKNFLGRGAAVPMMST
jgi:hypothetical protein